MVLTSPVASSVSTPIELGCAGPLGGFVANLADIFEVR